MAKLCVYILCDGDGNVRKHTIVEVDGLVADSLLSDAMNGMPSVVSAKDIPDRMLTGLRTLSPALFIADDTWISREVASRLLKQGGDTFSATVIANKDTYKDILELPGNIVLNVLSPRNRNAMFQYRGWERLGQQSIIYDDDGCEYFYETFSRSDTLDVSDADMESEIDRLTAEINTDPVSLDESDDAEIDRVVARIIAAWNTSEHWQAQKSPLHDDDDEDEDDGVVDAEEDDVRPKVTYTTNNWAESEDIKQLYSTMQLNANTLLQMANKVNNVEVQAMSSIGVGLHTRKQMARMIPVVRTVRHEIDRRIDANTKLVRELAAEVISLRRRMWIMAVIVVILAIAL